LSSVDRALTENDLSARQDVAAPVLSPEQRLALVRRHGTFTSAYSATFQDNLSHFGDAEGFLAYKCVGRTAFVLGEPIAPPEAHRMLITRFVRQQRDVCFVQVTRATASLLSGLGFLVNELGIETRIDLASFTFEGRSKRALRSAVNRMATLGYATREMPVSAVDPIQLRAMSDAWRATRTVRRREVTFLNRPTVLADEPDVRTFFAFDRDGCPVALGFFDPVYEDGRAVGYLYGIKRRAPQADRLAGYAIMHRAITTFQAEGRRWLHLGLSPFAGIEDKDFEHHGQIHAVARFLFTNRLFNRYVYNFQGLAQHKGEFGGVTEQTYYAGNTRPGLPRLLKLCRACSII
jgi:lysylphosphatidylglycerol synthetase-like protein (DUF2156 family)